MTGGASTAEPGYMTGTPPSPFHLPYPSPHVTIEGFVVHRTPSQQRVVMESRIARWFGKAHEALPDDISREDMIACVYGIRGWSVRARISEVIDERRPAYGWLLTHPEHGIIVYADKPRDGDIGPRFRAPTGGSMARPRFVWAEDVVSLMDTVVPTRAVPGSSPFPASRVVRTLSRLAFRSATVEQQSATELLLALTGRNLSAYLITPADDLSVQSV